MIAPREPTSDCGEATGARRPVLLLGAREQNRQQRCPRPEAPPMGETGPSTHPPAPTPPHPRVGRPSGDSRGMWQDREVGGGVARPAHSTWPGADRAHAHAGGKTTPGAGRGQGWSGGGDKQNSSNALKPFSFPMSRLWECCGYSSLKEGSS